MNFFLFKPDPVIPTTVATEKTVETVGETTVLSGSAGTSGPELPPQEAEVEKDEYYIHGSWESLMQTYGEGDWASFKMIPIKDFIEHFDPEYKHQTWEEYYQNQIEMIAQDKLAALKKAKFKFKALQVQWKVEYEKEFVKTVDYFI